MQLSSATQELCGPGQVQSLGARFSMPDGAIAISAGDRMRKVPAQPRQSLGDACVLWEEITQKLAFPVFSLL